MVDAGRQNPLGWRRKLFLWLVAAVARRLGPLLLGAAARRASLGAPPASRRAEPGMFTAPSVSRVLQALWTYNSVPTGQLSRWYVPLRL